MSKLPPLRKTLFKTSFSIAPIYRFILSGLIASHSVVMAEVTVPQLSETTEQKEERIKWFRDAKFGLFIHWGPAAISGEEISWGMKDRIEGGAHHKVVPRETYMNLYKGFNPVKFDADDLLSLADGAGMKYIVFVTKHHDGFCMWETKETRFKPGAPYAQHYSIADTPYGKDILTEVKDATQKHGLKLGWYYSTRDWTHPDYLVGDNKVYNDYYENQVEELLSEYGPVDLMWFDHCFGSWDQYTIPRLHEKMYKHNPHLLLNNRAVRGLPDVPKEYLNLTHADFDTPENRMGTFQHGRPWESCMILSPSPDHAGWSYRPDSVTRSLKETINLLSSCVTGDGNMLLNLAPLPDGSIKPEERAILEGIAPWINKYGEAIYETRGGPWINGTWGGSTYKGKNAYIHLINATDKPLVLNRLKQSVVSVTTIEGKELEFEETDKTLSLTLPKEDRDQYVSIIKITFDTPIESVLYGPALANEAENTIPGTIDLALTNAKLNGDLTIKTEGKNTYITNWSNPKHNLSWNVNIDSPGKYRVQVSTSATKPGSIFTAHFGKAIGGCHSAVPTTGSIENFQTYTLGEVYFPNAEELNLVINPAHHHAWEPIQLKSVKLIPVN